MHLLGFIACVRARVSVFMLVSSLSSASRVRRLCRLRFVSPSFLNSGVSSPTPPQPPLPIARVLCCPLPPFVGKTVYRIRPFFPLDSDRTRLLVCVIPADAQCFLIPSPSLILCRCCPALPANGKRCLHAPPCLHFFSCFARSAVVAFNDLTVPLNSFSFLFFLPGASLSRDRIFSVHARVFVCEEHHCLMRGLEGQLLLYDQKRKTDSRSVLRVRLCLRMHRVELLGRCGLTWPVFTVACGASRRRRYESVG